jgi:hypothetical protein
MIYGGGIRHVHLFLKGLYAVFNSILKEGGGGGMWGLYSCWKTSEKEN